MELKKKSKRGFASMSPEKQREIASKGGKRAHAMGKAHKWDVDEARAAGAKGGKKIAAKHGREHMAEIGRRGGLQRGVNLRKRKTDE